MNAKKTAAAVLAAAALACGLAVPAGALGQPNITAGTPKDWRQSFYYRYYIEGGEHNTPAHYGVRTHRYKLIRYYKQDEWELFDLRKDPEELHNLYGDPAYANVTEALKIELFRLKAAVGDCDQFYHSGEYAPAQPVKADIF